MRTTARAIIIRNGAILLMERWRGDLHYFSVPGGGVEPGESIEQAVIRELREEMGIEISPGRELYVMKTPDSTHHLLLCESFTGTPEFQLDSEEARDQLNGFNRFKPVWVPLSELAPMPFEYWKPIQRLLLHDLQHGFEGESKTIVVEA